MVTRIFSTKANNEVSMLGSDESRSRLPGGVRGGYVGLREKEAEDRDSRPSHAVCTVSGSSRTGGN
jgi:hypothetical protein